MAKKSTAKKAKKKTARKAAGKRIAKKTARKKPAAAKTVAKRKSKPAVSSVPASTSVPAGTRDPLIPPPGGAAVRMYRIGHGDCFLIAFASENPEKPAYVLIDCGYKPGSPGKLTQPTDAKAIGQHIIATTGGFVDVAVVTHEHQDHVNAITDKNFPDLRVGKVWFAWTENPTDDIANALRKKFKDRLLGLIDARAGLRGAGKSRDAEDLKWFLEFELGEDVDQFNGRNHAAATAKDPAKSANKVAMKYLRDRAPGDPDYLYPHSEVRPVPGATSARAFVLGPPRDIGKIDDLDPAGAEDFGKGFGAATAGGAAGQSKGSPFPARHTIPLDQVFKESGTKDFFAEHYGDKPIADADDGKQVPESAVWRRMTADDAADAGALALAMNNATNNASLVLAFELSKGGKVLLFVGDAQAGNWRSWSDDTFDDGGTKVTAEDLLSRTVLYKVGHHGSHNATLKGKSAPGRASLAGMGLGMHAGEFVAMITAVEAWAHQKPKPDWNHPLPAIKQALVEKAGGRVLQTDSSLPAGPSGAGAAGWQAFMDRVTEKQLYFDLRIDA
jgi:beta-lactamase superfamily II metal-dependent hydrolase